MTDPTYLHSLAHMAVTAQTPVATVQRLLDEIGARPMFVLNLTPYYSAEVLGTVLARANGWTDQPAYHRRYDAPAEVRSHG